MDEARPATGRRHASQESSGLMREIRGATSACALARAQLTALLDGELAGADSAWVDSHLAGCGDCGREREELVALRSVLSRALDSPELPES
ncbi:MAG: zf-HC2 domain-containing protein, partial [Alphaproteobacteria bacterium]